MDFINTLLVIAVLVNAVAALSVLSRPGKSDSASRLFVALIVNIILWTLTMIAFRYVSYTPFLSLIVKLLYALPIFIPVLLLHFVCVFSKCPSMKHGWVYFLYAYTFVLAIVTMTTDLVVYNPLIPFIGEKTFQAGILYGLHAAHYMILSSLVFYRLYVSYVQSTDPQFRKPAILLFYGSMLSLSIGQVGNLWLPWMGVFTLDWIANFFTVLYASAVMYAMVKYHLFNIKVVAVEFLAAFLVGFPIIELVFSHAKTESYVGLVFLILIVLVSMLLVKGVYTEIEQRERIEKQEKDLEIANAGQVNLIHILNHQIKGYLSKGRNSMAEVLDGTYGKIPKEAKAVLTEGFAALTEGVAFTTQILNASSVANGTMQYTMTPFDMKSVVEEVVMTEKELADKKGLVLSAEIGNDSFQVLGDATQLREMAKNVINNAIMYTQKGSVHVALSRKDDKIVFSVKDTGVGISPEDRDKIFTEGGRGKDALRYNSESTGYGLSFAKGVIVAPRGTIQADSDGSGKGSLFTVELPVGIAG